MDDWVIPAIIIAAVFLMIGNYSTLQKNAKTPLRKKGLNDLEETLPRSTKKEHKMPKVPTKTQSYKSDSE
jgi:hypothetical protein